MQVAAPASSPAVKGPIVAPGDIAADPAFYKGAEIVVPGMYLHSAKAVFDEQSIVTSMIPGPVAGAPSVKVDQLPEDLLAKLHSDQIHGTGERWGRVELTGHVDAVDGVAHLRVTGGEVLPDREISANPDDFGGFITD